MGQIVIVSVRQVAGSLLLYLVPPIAALGLLPALTNSAHRTPLEIVTAFVLPALLAVGLGATHYIKARRVARAMGYRLARGELPSVSQTIEVPVERPASEVEQTLRSAMGETNLVILKSGDHLKAIVVPNGSTCTVRISSKPGWRWTKVDFGRNLANVARMARAFRPDQGHRPASV